MSGRGTRLGRSTVNRIELCEDSWKRQLIAVHFRRPSADSCPRLIGPEHGYQGGCVALRRKGRLPCCEAHPSPSWIDRRPLWPTLYTTISKIVKFFTQIRDQREQVISAER